VVVVVVVGQKAKVPLAALSLEAQNR